MNTSGTVVERYLYTPYGEVTVLDGDFSSDADGDSDYSNTTLYTGRTFDPATGLYYYRHRVYHPRLGRFVSRDPVGYAASEWNLNEFVASNPLNHVDPFGDVWHHLFPWQFQDEFNDLNIDINSPMFGWDLPPEDHAKLHPLWNEEWEYFFTNNPDPTPMQVYEQLQDMRKDPKFCKYLKKGTKTEIPYPYRHTRSAYGRLIGKASKGGKAAKLLNAIGPILWGIQIGKGVAGGCDDELGNAKKELGCFAGNPTQLQCQAAISSLATYAECLGMEEAISGLALHKAILEVCTKFK